MLIPSLGGGGRGDLREDVCSLFTHTNTSTSGSLDIIRPCLLYRALDKLCRSSRTCVSISPQSHQAPPPTPTHRCVRTQVWRLNEKGAFVTPYITHTHFQGLHICSRGRRSGGHIAIDNINMHTPLSASFSPRPRPLTRVGNGEAEIRGPTLNRPC